MDQQKRYIEYEDKWKDSEKRVLTERQLAEGFEVADIYLNRNYLDKFSSAPIIPIQRQLLDINQLRFIKVNKLIYDKSEKFTDKLKSVYSALNNLKSSVAIMIRSNGIFIEFYIGVKSTSNTSVVGDLLESSLKGNFPGIKIHSLNISESQDLINEIKDSQIKSMSSVSIIPSMREDKFDTESFVQGFEKFIDTMSGKKYTVICLATPLDDYTIQCRKHGYEELCSSMSPHAKLSIAYGENESLSVNESISANFSKSINRSVSNSNTNSSSSSSGTNSGRSGGNSSNFGMSGDGWNGGWGSNSGWSNGSFNSYTSGNSFTQSVSDSEGTSTSEGRSKGNTESKGSSKTITINYENKGVTSLIERAQAELNRFKICESFGMWEFCGYFMSQDIHTTALAGNVYKAIMTGDNSNVESAHLNVWSLNQRDSINKILDYILNLEHPQAEIPAIGKSFSKQIVTPTNLVSGHELPLVMGFPKKSVSGLPVVEMAEYGRSVVYENKEPKRMIDIGSIYHMGVTEESRVKMDLDLLASHCFITGSSGSGKSYATYQLLQKLLENEVKILIIEPAKGEYKQIFGGLKGIKIYTTDPNAYRLLKINPFQFPDSIHILSHIEQLLQIFNASWPLYAAMPAILKEAVVEAYVRCGWDVQNSLWIPNVSDHKYPVFKDVLNILPNIINTSDYSSDSKGDYKGALLTRVQSMTTGINGLIFKNSVGIADSVLFESNTVIDLSELGSDEAIALIMGILIMKLNEYRKSQRKADSKSNINSGLQHVTVLEEAHNLLKRTSKEQNQDGANMIGKSVEMISNSIKEMRTYGEGFLIIDQSPMAVDNSAIENTATKIIMNTPAKDACEELGSALSLNDEQTAELSRLNVGVAAVYQKGWLSPVLMKIDKWDDRYNHAVEYTNQSSLKICKGKLVSTMIEQKYDRKFSPMKLRAVLREAELTADKKREIEDIISVYNDTLFTNKTIDREEFGELMLDIVGCRNLFDIISLDMIPTYDEFIVYDVKSQEFDTLVSLYEEGVEKWFKDIFNALSLYLYLENDSDKIELILSMIYVVGSKGQIKYNPSNKLAMVCRMLYRIFGLNL